MCQAAELPAPCCPVVAVLADDNPADWQAAIDSLRRHDADRSHRHWHIARGRLADAIRRLAGRMRGSPADAVWENMIEEAIDGRGHYEEEVGQDGTASPKWKRVRKGLIEYLSESAGPVPSPVAVVRTALANARKRPRCGDQSGLRVGTECEDGSPSPSVQSEMADGANDLGQIADPRDLPAEVAKTLELAAGCVLTYLRCRANHKLPGDTWVTVLAEYLDDCKNTDERIRIAQEISVPSVLLEWAEQWAAMAQNLRRDIGLAGDRVRWQYTPKPPFIERTDAGIRAWQARYHTDHGHDAFTSPSEVPVGSAKTNPAKACFDKHSSEFWKAWARANACGARAVAEFARYRPCGLAVEIPRLLEWSTPYHPTLVPSREKSGGKVAAPTAPADPNCASTKPAPHAGGPDP